MLQAAEQQRPWPVTPQTPEAQDTPLLQGWPVSICCTQLPLTQ
jgi:hypothetical protein